MLPSAFATTSANGVFAIGATCFSSLPVPSRRNGCVIVTNASPKADRPYRHERLRRKVLKVECRKKGLHPTFIEECKVYCDGEFIMTTSGTQKEYNVDTWSGNHPFYLGQSEYDNYDDGFYDVDDGFGDEDDINKEPET